MMQQAKRGAWQMPWGYTESIAIVVGVTFIGVILQLTIGSFDFFLLANPVNKITGLVIFVMSLLLGLAHKRSAFARWFSAAKLSVSLIAALLLLTIIMGLTPQVASGGDSSMKLGFDSMTTNWSFVMLYALTLIALGAVVVRRASRFCLKKDTPFMLQHVGLWLILVAAGLGYADMERYIMYVEEHETQWRVYGADNQVKELPIAIHLNDFDMEVYPPKIAVVDRNTGAVQPEAAAEYFQIDEDVTRGQIAGWSVENLEYIHQAVRGADSTYRNVPMPGATPAIKIKVERDGHQAEGWICGGNQLMAYMSLSLDEKYSVVMTPAEPRRFTSDVEVYSQQGDVVAAQIEVNKPLRVGSWMIYQYGYDNAAGSLSSYSSFELVYDPWLIPIYIGVVLLMLGALCMVVQGRSRVNAKKERV